MQLRESHGAGRDDETVDRLADARGGAAGSTVATKSTVCAPAVRPEESHTVAVRVCSPGDSADVSSTVSYVPGPVTLAIGCPSTAQRTLGAAS